MKTLIASLILATILISGCMSNESRQKMLTDDDTLALIFLRATNTYDAFPSIDIKNLASGKIYTLRPFYEGNRGISIIQRVEPGTYELHRYKLFQNMNPSLTNLDFKFMVEEGKINYVGDWHFDDNLVPPNLNFELEFSSNIQTETIDLGKKQFEIIFNTWPIVTQDPL